MIIGSIDKKYILPLPQTHNEDIKDEKQVQDLVDSVSEEHDVINTHRTSCRQNRNQCRTKFLLK